MLGWNGSINGNKLKVDNAIYAMVRQIGFEIVDSLKPFVK
jgi:hypothetical protein